MPNYAISNGSKIINVVFADSKENAESSTGHEAIETDGSPWIDWYIVDGEWRPPAPYDSWVWNEDHWESPVPIPEDENFDEDGNEVYFVWNEQNLVWESKPIL